MNVMRTSMKLSRFSVAPLGSIEEAQAFLPFEFHMGMMSWPFASCPPIPAHTCDVGHAVACRVQHDDFTAGAVELSLRMRGDRRLAVMRESGGALLGEGLRPLGVSTGAAAGATSTFSTTGSGAGCVSAALTMESCQCRS